MNSLSRASTTVRASLRLPIARGIAGKTISRLSTHTRDSQIHIGQSSTRRYFPDRLYSTTAPSPPSPAQPIQSFQDPSRPELYYHLVQNQNQNALVYAVSFLPNTPIVVGSASVIGTLPANVESNGAQDESVGAGLHDFKENGKFLEVLHSSIQRALVEGLDENVKAEALQHPVGWMHINDLRNVPALGRIGDPDDIIGSVRVDDGVINAETYQPMPSYRVCTSDGITTLSPGLHQTLVADLEDLHQKEKELIGYSNSGVM